LVHVVVDGVAGDDQSSVRHVQDRGVVGVRVADVHGNGRVALEFEERIIQWIGDGVVLGDLARESGQPE
jgi:hypothetical protein